jgi:hypothetical protein
MLAHLDRREAEAEGEERERMDGAANKDGRTDAADSRIGIAECRIGSIGNSASDGCEAPHCATDGSVSQWTVDGVFLLCLLCVSPPSFSFFLFCAYEFSDETLLLLYTVGATETERFRDTRARPADEDRTAQETREAQESGWVG